MKKRNLLIISSLTMLLGLSTTLQNVHAKDMNGDQFGSGNEIITKKRTKVTFVKIFDTHQGVSHKIVGYKYVPKGTHLYGFYKSTEGVDGCFYNFKKGIKITKMVWPSVPTNTKNIKVIHKYHHKYNLTYTFKHILHASLN